MTSRTHIWLIASILISAGGCGGGSTRSVVVYAALDREFSEPILEKHARTTGVEVDAKYDVESTKTVGLTTLLIAEARNPRCDLFWNNEILNTLRLKKRGLLAEWTPANAGTIPAEFKDREKTWYGFAARARILLVNTRLVPEAERPRSVFDLTDPRWKGRIGIAKPLAGTTATHAVCLFQRLGAEKARKFFEDLKANDVRILSGNKQAATAVGEGELAFALTDTDDALGEIDAGRPVAIVYPDRGANELGTLFIPNTIALLKNAPHRTEAERLGNELLSVGVENALASGPSAQIPLHPEASRPARVETPVTVKPMPVDFEKAADLWDEVTAYLASRFAG